jgi:antitoxin component YwqK of YwqJK toxin-antitoxin module
LSSEREFDRNQLIDLRYYTRSGQVIQDVHTGLLDKKEIVFFDDMLEKENELKYATYYGSPVKLKKGMIAFTMHTMDGEKAALVHFTDRSLRNKSGPFYKYDEKGQLRIAAYFRENRLDGPFKRWYPNGRLSDSGLLVKNRQEGLWMTWYPDGSRKDSGLYVQGQREGLWTVWEEGTQIRAIGLFEQQVRTGEWKFYDPEGKFLYAKRYRNKWKYGETELIDIHN